eukprot:5875594-Amphidinium_carterae.1
MRHEFNSLDTDGDGELSMSELEHFVRDLCGFSTEQDVPEHLLNQHWRAMDLDGSSSVDFEDMIHFQQREVEGLKQALHDVNTSKL